MKIRVDLSRPDMTFATLWLVASGLAILVPTGFVWDFQSEIAALILFNVASFFAVYFLIRHTVGRAIRQRNVFRAAPELSQIYRLTKWLLVIWLPFYLLTIFLSGGIPVWWILTGDGRTYLDFGVPTLSGFLYMVRAFIFSVGVMVYVQTGNKRTLWLPGFMLATGLAEVSRGNTSVMLLHGIGMYLLCRKEIGRLILILPLLAIIFILAFGYIAEFRGGARPVEELAGEGTVFSVLPAGFFWVYTYIVSPINNVNYAYDQGIDPLGYPYYSVLALLPTVLRDSIFSEVHYPVQLLNEALNATSFYAPLIADFGMLGAALVVVMLQIIVSYVHVCASRGKLFYMLVYPVLYMCVVMSVFYLFFFSMITVMYPVFVSLFTGWLAMRRTRKGVSCVETETKTVSM